MYCVYVKCILSTATTITERKRVIYMKSDVIFLVFVFFIFDLVQRHFSDQIQGPITYNIIIEYNLSLHIKYTKCLGYDHKE